LYLKNYSITLSLSGETDAAANWQPVGIFFIVFLIVFLIGYPIQN
jgi:hypothetical protein